MKHYELMYITDPSSEEGIDEVKQKIEGIVTGRGGTVESFEKIGKKRLAYPIAKCQYGFYFLVNLSGDGRIVQAMDYYLRLSPIVLRHLILAFTEKVLNLRALTERIQREEAERMRMGGKPLQISPDADHSEDKKDPDVDSAEVKPAIVDEIKPEEPAIEPSTTEVAEESDDEEAASTNGEQLIEKRVD